MQPAAGNQAAAVTITQLGGISTVARVSRSCVAHVHDHHQTAVNMHVYVPISPLLNDKHKQLHWCASTDTAVLLPKKQGLGPPH